MAQIPSIDLHPEKLRGSGPETALLAARDFIAASLKRGHRSVRIITGLGIHGDGTPRLRSRVEREVLSGFFRQIESQSYEQGGAVIRLELQPGFASQGRAYEALRRNEAQHKVFVAKEERLMVAYERLESAEGYMDEGDLRRCRLKLNQIKKEFWPHEEPLPAELGSLKAALALIKKKIDALA